VIVYRCIEDKLLNI